jgi:alpha-beta hydrolase superfamily lysophospholipase
MSKNIIATGEQRVNSQDGTEIYVKSYNVASPKAQLLVVHGYLEHCLRYDEFAQAMVAHGIATTLFDYRGHGRSGGKRAYLDDWVSYMQDLQAAKATLGDKAPTFVLGHSNGGLITMDYMLHHNNSDDNNNNNNTNNNIKGIIISSPFLAPAEDLGWVAKNAAKLLGGYWPSFKLPANLKSDALTSDPVKSKEHKQDELCLPDATAGWAYRCMEAQDRVQTAIIKNDDAATIPVPILFAYSAEDRVAKASLNKVVAENSRLRTRRCFDGRGKGMRF